MSSGNLRAFLTGSHAYGIPNNKSDIDLVVFVTQQDLDKVAQLAKEHPPREVEYISAGGLPLRFGNMNLICCTNEKMYECWKTATRELKKLAPVTRDFAVEYMRRARVKAGFHQTEPIRHPTKDYSESDIPF